MAKYVYIAVRDNKAAKLDMEFGISAAPGDIFRNLAEMSSLEDYNVGKFEVKLVKTLKNVDSDYWDKDIFADDALGD